MFLKNLDFDVQLRTKEHTILTRNFVGDLTKHKHILFLYGTTGTGKTSLVEYFFNVTMRKEHKNVKYYYYNIIRTRSERLTQLFPILNSKKKEKHFIVLDEVDKADSQLVVKTIQNLLEVTNENKMVYFILVANDFRFFEKKFKTIGKKLVLKIPFPPFDKEAIKKYLRKIFIENNQPNKKKKCFIEDMINLVAVKIGNKKPDIRKSLVLCQELIANKQQEGTTNETRIPERAKEVLTIILSKFDKEVWVKETQILALANSLNKLNSKLSSTYIKENLEILCSLGKIECKTEKSNTLYKSISN